MFGLALVSALLSVQVSATGMSNSIHPRMPATVLPTARAISPGGLIPETAVPVPGDVKLGHILYEEHCSSCHGANLGGMPGAPSLRNAGGAAVEFYMMTGRMPLAEKADNLDPAATTDQRMAAGSQTAHQPAHFTAPEIAAIDDYVTMHAQRSIAAPTPQLAGASLVHGRRLFEANCEACHGVGAQGATAGYQWTALPLYAATPRQIAEAIRIGPGVMPRFTTAQLSESDVADIAKYIGFLTDSSQNYGGSTLAYLGPTAEGGIAAMLGVGSLMLFIYWIGTRAANRRKPQTDEARTDESSDEA